MRYGNAKPSSAAAQSSTTNINEKIWNNSAYKYAKAQTVGGFSSYLLRTLKKYRFRGK
jgi:hypothetical protein